MAENYAELPNVADTSAQFVGRQPTNTLRDIAAAHSKDLGKIVKDLAVAVEDIKNKKSTTTDHTKNISKIAGSSVAVAAKHSEHTKQLTTAINQMINMQKITAKTMNKMLQAETMMVELMKKNMMLQMAGGGDGGGAAGGGGFFGGLAGLAGGGAAAGGKAAKKAAANASKKASSSVLSKILGGVAAATPAGRAVQLGRAAISMAGAVGGAAILGGAYLYNQNNPTGKDPGYFPEENERGPAVFRSREKTSGYRGKGGTAPPKARYPDARPNVEKSTVDASGIGPLYTNPNQKSEIDNINPNQLKFLRAIGSTESSWNKNKAYSERFNQPQNNANVRRIGEDGADYGYFQNNNQQVKEAIKKYGMDPEVARHLNGGGKGGISTPEQQTYAMHQYLQKRWPELYERVKSGDKDAIAQAAEAMKGTWFGIRDRWNSRETQDILGGKTTRGMSGSPTLGSKADATQLDNAKSYLETQLKTAPEADKAKIQKQLDEVGKLQSQLQQQRSSSNNSGTAYSDQHGIPDVTQIPRSGKTEDSREFSPNVRGGKGHAGLDIPVKPGQPIKAHQDGVIMNVGQNPGGYGAYVDVKYADGSIHRLAHLGNRENAPYDENIKPGAKIKKGETVGYGGYSGNAGRDFPHVHNEVWRDKNGRKAEELYNYSNAAGGSRQGMAYRSNPRDYWNEQQKNRPNDPNLPRIPSAQNADQWDPKGRPDLSKPSAMYDATTPTVPPATPVSATPPTAAPDTGRLGGFASPVPLQAPAAAIIDQNAVNKEAQPAPAAAAPKNENPNNEPAPSAKRIPISSEQDENSNNKWVPGLKGYWKQEEGVHV